jgi:hypothetical protein
MLSADSQFLQQQDDARRQRCSGMYSRKAWGGDVEPFVLTKFLQIEGEVEGDPLVSVVIFEWNDEELIGRTPPGGGDVSPIRSLFARHVLTGYPRTWQQYVTKPMSTPSCVQKRN